MAVSKKTRKPLAKRPKVKRAPKSKKVVSRKSSKIKKKSKISAKKNPKTLIKKAKTFSRLAKSKSTRKTKTKKNNLLLKTKPRVGVELKKYHLNPIIEPRPYSWESKATFNPSAFLHDNKIHLIYRAIGDNDSSVLGYAESVDGYSIIDRPTYAIYRRVGDMGRADLRVDPIDYVSGGGWNGGCEDPRVTKIGDTIYMLYTAFDGWGSLRIAMTSLSVKDFENKKWNWKHPVLISPPGQIHKNWVIFPEKVNGKFAIMHSFYPKILIDYFDKLEELNGKKFIYSNNTRPVDKTRTWDSWFRGVGPAPIKTDMGWLVIYHAMDHKNPDRYRMGALILDLKDPTKILYRSSYPILEPEEHYENNGYKWGVVYTCGAVIKNGILFVYYGGADKVVGVATVPLEVLLSDLKKNKVTKLKKQSIKI